MSALSPRILTTLVGSYPVPEWLLAYPGEQNLIDATRVVLSIQETSGIDLVCDGELYRFDPGHPEANGMIEYFARHMDGIRTGSTFQERKEYLLREDTSYRNRPPGVVEAPVGHGSLDLMSACQRALSIATHPLKFTVTGPHMLSKVWVNHFYKSTPDLAHAIADVLAEQVSLLPAEVIQLDEANLPGHPEEWEWAASAINRVLDAIPGKAAVHLCFGNYAGRSVQKGSWDKLLDYLNSLHADHLVMENADRPESELEIFNDLRPDLGLGLGVVDIKTTWIETPEEIARSIEYAARLLGPERIRYVNPDCGFSKVKRFTADAKIKALVKGRDLFEGRQ